MPKASIGKNGSHLSRDCGINSADFVQQRRSMRRSARSRPTAKEYPNLPHLSAIRIRGAHYPPELFLFVGTLTQLDGTRTRNAFFAS